ncbi:DNA mismatch repair protein MutS [Auxenochlorella protothecoides]|uniref:DNA mismatch repair protein MutS n=1 Tax=Auxenochlorella protothecoides TaxID=3075 RepID=A0A087SJ79_AUXPR|nr:DNA mismatch repair protein MutS [Auxenochlorella protothecoides]KFM25783.1 DNA mismatch repair protein MutS [Auxenochlorella protothecoides]
MTARPSGQCCRLACTKASGEVEGYWSSILEGVEKPAARKLVKLLDPRQPMGLPAPKVEESNAKRSGPGKVPLLRFFLATKAKYPMHVLLVRVGEFFETVGIDAVLLVQHAGLNPMGDPESTGALPRAGCPRQNLRRTVSDLVEGAGLSVVVCEEEPEAYSYGSVRARQKTRYVAAVVTPAAPHLLLGLGGGDADVTLESVPPVLGLSPSVGGYTLMEVQPELRRLVVTEGLTEDAIHSRLYEGGLVPPLFLHTPPGPSDARLGEAGAEAEWELRIRELFRHQVGAVVKYEAADPVEGMLTMLRRQLNLDPSLPFTTTRSIASDRPRPLYFSSAVNLGLHKSRGVPPLLDCFTVTAAANLVLKIEQRQASDVFYRELAELCWAVEQTCSDPAHAELADALLTVSQMETGLLFGREELAEATRSTQQLIHEVIEPHPGPGPSPVNSEDAGSSPSTSGGLEVMAAFIRKNEDFRGKVKADRLPAVHTAVMNAGLRLEKELRAIYEPLLEASVRAGDPVKLRPMLRLDEHNNAVWLRLPRACSALHLADELGLWHPKDRMGKSEPGAHSHSAVDSATDDYRRACSEASRAVRRELDDLAARLQPSLPLLVTASMLSMMAAALEGHTWRVSSCSTGPNMAGKSTLLRSTAAVALLGACGLAVPARAARLPYLDAFMLRNFSADSPLEGRSSFAVEMTEMRYVLEDASPHSLVLVDELGKGTEARAGAALAGALLESLDATGCRGVFATHLHPLLELPLRLRATCRMRMATCTDASGARRPTLRMVPGSSTESLALEVARAQRLPARVLERAAALYADVQALHAAPEGGRGRLDDDDDEAAGRSGDAAVAAGRGIATDLTETRGLEPASAPATLKLRSLAEAGELLAQTASRVLEQLGAPGAASAGRSPAPAIDALSPPESPGPTPAPALSPLAVVRAGQTPPPRTVGLSCVYVVRRTDGWFYVGSTDSIKERLATHRRRSGASRVRDPQAEAVYMTVTGGEGAGSSARAIEAATIHALRTADFPLLSSADARLRQNPSFA